jgi:pSer/pThr/pTyr-binding forkhead associated (FHA) protein
MGQRIIIGRGEKTDIKILDSKASREHVEITKVGSSWVATDLGSQNGVMVNDKKITQLALAEGDKLIIGQTVFKFAKVEVAGKNRVIKEEADEADGGKKNTMIPLLLGALLIAFLLIDDDKPKDVDADRTKKEESSPVQDVSGEYITALKKRQVKEDKQIKERLSSIYQRGLREYREKNYFSRGCPGRVLSSEDEGRTGQLDRELHGKSTKRRGGAEVPECDQRLLLDHPASVQCAGRPET